MTNLRWPLGIGDLVIPWSLGFGHLSFRVSPISPVSRDVQGGLHLFPWTKRTRDGMSRPSSRWPLWSAAGRDGPVSWGGAGASRGRTGCGAPSDWRGRRSRAAGSPGITGPLVTGRRDGGPIWGWWRTAPTCAPRGFGKDSHTARVRGRRAAPARSACATRRTLCPAVQGGCRTRTNAADDDLRLTGARRRAAITGRGRTGGIQSRRATDGRGSVRPRAFSSHIREEP